MEKMKLLPDDPAQLAELDGPWMDSREIARELFNGKVCERWVRLNVPGKVTFSPVKVLWRRNRVLRWIADRQRLAG